nr:divalent metal cation transporter [Alishewanella agri]
MSSVFRFGPATLVTAAFIGPGTVVTASLAGANFGYALLWALLFSVLATLILQEMAARLGIVTGRGWVRICASNCSIRCCEPYFICWLLPLLCWVTVPIRAVI